MNKIRQFSFQDYIVSRQSEGGLDSLSSHMSSCISFSHFKFDDFKGDTQNSNRQYQGFPPPSSRNDPEYEKHSIYAYPTISNPLSNYENKFESQNQHGANIQNINSQTELEGTESLPRNGPESNFDHENMKGSNFHSEQILADQQNSEIQQKNQENWDRMDKINRMLEEHRRKKNASVTRSSLGRFDENSGLQEEEKPHENVIKLYPVQIMINPHHGNPSLNCNNQFNSLF